MKEVLTNKWLLGLLIGFIMSSAYNLIINNQGAIHEHCQAANPHPVYQQQIEFHTREVDQLREDITRSFDELKCEVRELRQAIVKRNNETINNNTGAAGLADWMPCQEDGPAIK